MIRLFFMAPGLRAFFRVLAVTLALAVTLGAVHERPEVVVIQGPPPAAAASLELTSAPKPVASTGQALRRRIASTNVPHRRRLVRLDPRGPYPLPPDTPVYRAYLRILC